MTSPNSALLVIDMVENCCLPGGSRFIHQDTTAVETRIRALASEQTAQGGVVVFCSDEQESLESLESEDECDSPQTVAVATDVQVVGSLRSLQQSAQSVRKYSFSAARDNSLVALLKQRHVKEVHVAGVGTDTSILFTAHDLRAERFSVVVHADAVLATRPERQKLFLDYMRGVLGVTIER